MISKILIFLFSLLLHSAKSDLLMVMEIFRHGAREPLFDWWNAKNFTHWGELTPVGMRQHYNLGQTLRKIYIEDKKFLSEQFNPDEIYVRSTDVNRTIISALSQLYGLYPLGSGPELPKGLDISLEQAPFAGYRNSSAGSFGLPSAFQPIPIHTTPLEQDSMLRPFGNLCEVSHELYARVQASEVYLRWNEEYKETFEQVGRLLNLTEEQTNKLNIDDISNIFDVFMDDIWFNKPIPLNISKELWTNMTVLYNVVIYYNLGGIKDISRFYNTPFFREVIQVFDEKLANPSNPLKWKIYSAHDWTVGTFTTGLNITDYKCAEELLRNGETNALNCELYPDFATNMLIELNQEDGKNYIQIRYNGNYMNLCEKAENKCEYDEFRERLSNYLVDYEAICHKTNVLLEGNKKFLANK